MKIELTAAPPQDASADWLIVPVSDAETDLDDLLDGAIRRRRQNGDFSGVANETLLLFDTPTQASRVLLVGVGAVGGLSPGTVRTALQTAMLAITAKPTATVAVAAGALAGFDGWVQEATRAAVLAGTSQGLYKADPKRHPINTLLVCGVDRSDGLQRQVDHGVAVGEAINVVRELVDRPASDVYPETFAERAWQLANEAELECDVLGPEWLTQEKFFSMLAVAQGSARPARLVVLKHRGGGDDGEWTGLCGKGVTFDSGGLSLKPSDGMKTMKADMAGGATVLGTLLAASRLGVKQNILGVIGLVENMVSGNSYKLGDVLRSRSGRTIEVHNTDAEGRLVLADVLNWTVDQGVTRIVDLATLTGACVVALGEDYVGMFPGREGGQAVADELAAAAEAAGELVWPLPMDDRFAKLLESEIADCKNVGPRWGGAITAAKFLEPFAGPTPWVHLDIAGPAFAESGSAQRDSGATGVMVETLLRMLSKG